MSSPYADTIAAALRERVAAIGQNVGNAGRTFTRAVQGVAAASDVEEVMRLALEATIAAEGLHKAAEAAVRLLRETLAEVIETTGCHSVCTEHHTASLKHQPKFLSISDEALIPREFYAQPPPRLDKHALLSALKDGIEIPGASIGIPNAMTLAIRARN
jgi:hypothetical protein